MSEMIKENAPEPARLDDEQEYDFDEGDFLPDADAPDVTDEADSSEGEHGIPLNDDSDSPDGDDESETESDEDVPPQKSKLGPIVAVAALAGVAAIGGFGYFAMKILGGGQAAPAAASASISTLNQSVHAPAQPAQINALSQQASGDNGQFNSVSPDDIEAALNGGAPSVSTQAFKQVEPSAQPEQPQLAHQAAAKDIVVEYDPNEPMQSNASSDRALEPSGHAVISDEEKMYDNLLSKVDGMDVPPEAIKIDQSVINKKLESQRLGSLEGEVKEARASISEMRSGMAQLQGAMTSLAKSIEANSAENKAALKSVETLSGKVSALNDRYEKDIDGLRNQITQIAKQTSEASQMAKAAKETAKAPVREVVREVVKESPKQPIAQAPAPKPVVQAPAPAPTPIMPPAPKPLSVVAPMQVANSVAPSAGLPPQCDGSRISSNWRVKGVSASAAYVFRAQDQQGLYLKVGLDVPGYGRVVALDAASRSVCTTSGLIRR